MYRFELVTAPTQEPVSLQEVKDFLRYYDSDEDGLILDLARSARLLVESHTQRQLVTATWKLHLDRFPAGDIQIRKIPVTSVSSITYYDTNGTSQTWDSDEYETDMLTYPALVRAGYGYYFPSTRSGKLNAVTIQFVAGSSVSAVDRRAKTAILLLTKHLFDNRDLVTPETLTETPMAFQALVNSLKWTAYAGAF